jgi:hypothetical protein
MEQKAIIQEGIKHQKPSREIRRQANKTNPDNIIGPKVVHNAKYNMHKASNPDISNRVNVADDILVSSWPSQLRKTGPNIIAEFELFRLMTLVFLKQSTVT